MDVIGLAPVLALIAAGFAAAACPSRQRRALLVAGMTVEFVALVGWAASGASDCGSECSGTNDVFGYAAMLVIPIGLLAAAALELGFAWRRSWRASRSEPPI